jgi:hypothetical protein
MAPELKIKGFYQRHGQAMLLFRLVPSIAPETRPRIPELQGGTLVEHSFCMSNKLVLVSTSAFCNN